MTDNDSLRPEDFEPHRAKPEQINVRSSFAQAFRERPLLRVAVIILPVVVVIAVIFSMFGHHKVARTESTVTASAETKPVLPGDVVPKKYNDAVNQVNEEKTAQAKASGDSMIPTTLSTSQASTAMTTDPMQTFQTAPVVATAPIIPAPSAPPPGIQQQAYPQQQQPQVDPQKLTQLSSGMQSQIQPLLTSQVPKSIKIMVVASPPSNDSNQNYQGYNPAPQTKPEGKIIVTAGTVSYGQTLTEANSDVPAPILVSILSGPFAGCRAIATFQKTPDYLIMAFGTIIKDKLEYHVNALATDPETTLTALETSTDHHYFDRFVLPAAAAFVSGIGQSIATEGTVTTENQIGGVNMVTTPTLNTHQQLLLGLGAAAQSVSNAVSQDSNRQPTIHVASGTPIGILFVNSVHEILPQ